MHPPQANGQHWAVAHRLLLLLLRVQAFSARGTRAKRHIAGAALAAARRALRVALGPRRTAAPGVIKYFAHLLRPATNIKAKAATAKGSARKEEGAEEGGEGEEEGPGKSQGGVAEKEQEEEEDVGCEKLCQEILVELHHMPRKLSMVHKSYYSELAAVGGALHNVHNVSLKAVLSAESIA